MAHFQVARKLYVMGGQRSKQPLSDMLTLDLQSDETVVLANGKDTCSMCIAPSTLFNTVVYVL